MVTAEGVAGLTPARGLGGRSRAAGLVVRVSAVADRLARRAQIQSAGVLLLALLAARSGLDRHPGLDVRVAVVLALAATAPLLGVRVFPLASLGLPVAAGGVFIVVARLAWPATAVVGWLVALALCPLRLRRSRAVAVLAVAEVCVGIAVFVPQRINATPWDATIAEGLAALIAWWVGDSVRARRDARAEQADLSRRVQVLVERDAVARERARIARELHDVVAHHVSTIAVRAATLPYEIAELPPPARTAFAEIAEGARAVLADLRAVLGVLRDSGDEVDGAPQPRLADLPELVTRVRAVGAQTVLTMDGKERTLPDSVQVCGYRIVQEALTNAVRHAPGSKIYVNLRFGPDGLTVSVCDDGATSGPVAAGGGGYGLIGMRERVAMLGGSLRTGRREGGGFELVAVLPCPGAAGGGQ